MGIGRCMEWPEPRNLNTLEEISEYCTLIYKHLTEESFLRMGDIALEFANTTTLNIGGPEISTLGTAKIDNLAITTAKIKNAAVEAAKIATGAVEEAKIAADAVTATKIAVSGLDGASGDVAANHIVAGMLQSNCVTTVKLNADSVTAPKINVVGLDGTSGRICVTDETDANVVTGGVNSHATTLIQAGKILISGSTPLSDWSHASDATLIDGGDIYTSSVTATQIAANTITIDKLTTGLSPNLLKAKYTDFQSFANDDNIGVVVNGTATCDTGDFYIGDRCLQMVASAADNHAYLGTSSADYNIRLEPSTKHIVSYYAKASSGTPTVGGFLRQDDGTHKTIGTTTITTSWARYQFTVTTDSNLTDSGLLRIDNDTNGATVWFDAIQVEKASAATSPEATPYKPSGIVEVHGGQIEADTITATQIAGTTITAAEMAANTITVGQVDFDAQLFTDGTTKTNVEAWKHASDATLIDGGDIYANSVTATQINAGTITATEINTNTITLNKLETDLDNSLYGLTVANNVGIGTGALASITTGTGNVAFGQSVLASVTGGGHNVGIGYEALTACTVGGGNLGIGYTAGHDITIANENIAIGDYALALNTKGSGNVALGWSALAGYNYAASDATTKNVAIGAGTGGSLVTGTGNIFLGFQAGGTETGSNKLYIANSNTTTPLIGGVFPNTSLTFTSATTTFSGTVASADITVDSKLVLSAGSITDGDGAISFGNENLSTTGTLSAGVATLATSSTIGNLTLANGSIIDSGGSISFGNENLSTTGTLTVGASVKSTTGNLLLDSSTPGTDYVCSQSVYDTTTVQDANVFIYDNAVGPYALIRSTSAKRYKDKVKNLELESSLIHNLRPVSFNSLSKADDKNRRFVGLIADEIGEVYPEIVEYNENGEAENYDNQMLMTLILAEVQKLRQEINKMKEN